VYNSVMIRERVFGLDLLRALAVLLVLGGHATFMFLPLTSALDGWWLAGQLGVELFFVLSGFLIGGILIDEFRSGRFRLKRFWTRRWLRTLPNYFLFLALNIVLYRAVHEDWPQFAAYLVFMQNFAWPHPQLFPEAWSLSVEELFYLIAPLVVLALGRSVRWRGSLVAWLLLAIAFISAIRIGYVLWYDPSWDAGVRKVALVRLDAFIYGVIAVWFYAVRGMSMRSCRLIAIAGFFGIAVSALAYLLLPRDDNFFARTFLFNLVSASLAALLPFAAGWHGPQLPQSLRSCVRRVALWSYSLYLCQLGVMRCMMEFSPWKWSTPAQCALAAVIFVVVAIGCAAFVYHFFELPILRWRDRITGRSIATDTMRPA